MKAFLDVWKRIISATMIGLAFILVFTLLFKENGTKMLQIDSI